MRHRFLDEDTRGQWWAMCLGVRPRKEGDQWRTSVFERETMLLPVRWKDDWPIFNKGNPITLKMTGPNAYVLQEDKAWKDDFTSDKLSLGWYRKNFQPESLRVEAGTVVWWHYTCYASIGIALRKHGDKSQRIVRFTSPNAETVEQVIAEKWEVKFIVNCTEKSYRFGYREVSDQTREEKEDIGAPFTGMMLGLYSFGNMEPVLTPAKFAYAEFR
ncbi:hypothetical protein EJ02DRAFT_419575 [Clathrospora elynae]|uniref:Beta-xylosidase C-terminal Concanavalin A-like domain-containing protein n=1 Tax=Clathrospora elynae TaxID=706981 RepID=A0A6A5SZH0_9PLEO|nr:hypothetical protein EJ02DRAFT_419575 [Clathrospora elynae]